MSSERENILEVLETEQRWAQAHLDLDLSVIESLLSDDYRHFGPDGNVTGKAELLASYSSGERFWEIAVSSDHDVRILGKVAVLTGTWRGVGINGGEAFDYSTRFVCLYVREDGIWRLYMDWSIPSGSA